MREEHLDFLPSVTRQFIFWCGRNRSGNIARILMEIARHLAHRRVRATTLLQVTDITVLFAGTINPCPFGRDPRSWRIVSAVELLQFVPGRTDVSLVLGFPGEVRT